MMKDDEELLLRRKNSRPKHLLGSQTKQAEKLRNCKIILKMILLEIVKNGGEVLL